MTMRINRTQALNLLTAIGVSLLTATPAIARDLLDTNAAFSPPTQHIKYNQRALNERILGWREFDNVPYIKGEANPLQSLDLLLPQHAKRQRVPLIVYIHGGGWYEGDKKLCPARILTNFGYAVASINYRLTPDARFPAQIEDCKAALRFLHDHASKYGIDPDRIGVWGLSAGGHLAALLGTTSGTNFGGTQDSACSVKAVVDWFGPTDFTKFVDLSKLDPIADKALTGLFGGYPADHKDAAVAASPVTYAKPDLPPFLIMHGDKDNIVPLDQSTELYKTLKNSGANAQMVVVPGAGHEMFGPDYIKQVVEFFDSFLKGQTKEIQRSNG